MVRYRQKRNNQDFKKVELYAHCSLLRIHKLVFFLVALIKIYFIVKLYTHVEYIHASEYDFFQNVMKLVVQMPYNWRVSSIFQNYSSN